MDLNNIKALIGVTYLIPIAITLRKIYAPNFDLPESFSLALAKLDLSRGSEMNVSMASTVRQSYEMRV